MNFPKRIHINEVGPRDGLQNEKQILSARDKADLINDIIDSGVKTIEVGSLVHPRAIPALADTDEVYKLIDKPEGVELRVLVTNVRGVQRAIDAGMKKVKLTVSASESHNLNNFNRTPEDSVKGFRECYDLAKSAGLDVSAAISTAFGCPFEGDISMEQITPIIDAFVELGITELSLSDPTGMANPKEVREKSAYVLEKYKDITWNLHFHNTRDMGFANILSAMSVGMTRFDAAFSAIGGCPYAPGASGNVCTEDLIHMLHEMGIETGIDLDKSIGISRKVTKLVGHKTDSYLLRAGKVSDVIRERPLKQTLK